MPSLRTLWTAVRRRIWFRTALFSVAGFLTALAAAVIGPLLPYDVQNAIDAGDVEDVLAILTSSMLAVTTFSVTIMLSAMAGATSNATPRATSLIMEDSTTQNVLATFLGAFLFAVVGIIALKTGIYGASGRVVLFASAILVILWVAITLLRWVDHLSTFGRMSDIVDRIEAKTCTAIAGWRAEPWLGGIAAVPVPAGALRLCRPDIGHIRSIDVPALSALADASGATIHILARPGAFIHPARPVLAIEGDIDPDKALNCIVIGHDRSFEQDPRFGLIVLAEVGSRALSPAINDPGTVYRVLGAGLRTLAGMDASATAEPPEDRCRNVHVPTLDPAVCVDDFFVALLPDLAPHAPLVLRANKSLDTLALLVPAMAGPVSRLKAELDARATAENRFPPDLARMRSC